MTDLTDCTCIQTVGFSKRTFPCLVHGMTFASKTERIELLEERVSRLEAHYHERKP